MALAMLLFLAALTTYFGGVASETHVINTKIGYDLHLPVTKAFEVWDLYAGDKRIGNYHSSLKPLNGYKDRLQFSSECGDIILKKWTLADGLTFTVAVKTSNENGHIQSYDIHYNVSVNESVHSVTRSNTKSAFSSSSRLTVSTILSLPSVLCVVVIGILCFYGLYI